MMRLRQASSRRGRFSRAKFDLTFDDAPSCMRYG